MVYIDLLVIQDLIYNYVILTGVSILLTRRTNIKKIFLSSVIGTIPIIFLFLNINNLINFFLSFLFSIIMSIISFQYKNIIYSIKNIFYMYATSIFVAGFIYLINTNILPNINNYILNVIILIILSPILTFIYIKSISKFKTEYSKYYKVDIYLTKTKKVSVIAFLDTGNRLTDPYKKRPIILLKKKLMANYNYNKKILLVPYNTINKCDLLKCIVPEKIYIDNVGFKKNFLIGLIDEVNIEGADCILHNSLLERV